MGKPKSKRQSHSQPFRSFRPILEILEERNLPSASQLAITQTPGTTTAGQSLSPSLQVSVEDQYGNVVTGSAAPVTVSVASGPGGFASGTTTMDAVNGVATFSNLILDTAGSYTLTASDSTDGLTPATTSITISPTAASQLVITQAPGTATAGQVYPLQVSVEDQYGNVVTGSTAPVTVASGSGGMASGTTTVDAVNGVVTFNNLFLNKAGIYPIIIYDLPDGLTPATTGSITVSPGAASQLAFTPNPITTLANFNGLAVDGSVVMDGNGNLYGIYGDYGTGTIFEIAKGTDTVTTLATFNGDVEPSSLTIDSSGNLFGTTEEGGTYYAGDIFELTKGSNTITTLASFTGDTGNGGLPRGVIVDSSGNLFGATTYGGTYEFGTVFELAAGSSTITTLASFANDSDIGGEPDVGVTMDSSGNLFGTTSNGGANYNGTVYELAKGSSTITTLASFNSYGGTGSGIDSSGVVVDSSDNIYGTTQGGGTYDAGTVYEVTRGSGIITNLASFSDETGSTTGYLPYAGLVMDSSGNLFGTTPNGPLSPEFGYGTVFELAQGSNTIATLAAFNYGNGDGPRASVILDSSGNIIGTTVGGGAGGTVFELPKTPTGQVYTAGQVMSPYLQVNVEDAYGNVVGYNGPFTYPITMSVTSGPGSFASGSTTTEYGNMTTFYNLILDTTGNYTLTASDTQDGLTSATTNVTISPNASKASPSIVATASGNITLGTTDPKISDSAVLSGGNNETGSLVFTLKLGSTTVYTTSDTLTGDGTYTANYTLPTTGIVAGTYTWSVSYAGDANNNGAVDEGGTAQQTVVSPASSSSSVTASTNPSVFGQPVTFTGTVSSNASWANPPTGIVTFMDGSTILGTGTLNAVSGNDQATFTTSLLSSATHNSTAVYAGDGNFLGSTTAVLSQVVSATPLLENGVLAIPGTTSAATITLTPTLPTGASTYSMKVTRTIGTTTTTLGTFAVPTGIVQVYGGPGTATVTLNGTSSNDAFTTGSGTVSEVAAQNTAQATSFTVGLTAVTALTLNGSGGTDSLTGPNQANTWTVTGSNAGTLNSTTTFTGIANLTGGTVQDTFKFLHGGSLSGNLIGEAPTNTLDDSQYGSPVTVNLQTTKATAISGTWANLQNLIGTGTTDTLDGANTANTWSINGANAGTVGAYSFSAFPNLTGGSGNDRFAFLSGGSITGKLNGGSGINTLDDSGYGSPVTVNLQTTKATGIGGTFSSIQSLIGTGTTDTLIGANSTNSWTITGSNAGTVGSYSFSAFPDLTGGTGNDTFKFVSPGTLSGTLNGGGGNDTITGDNNGDSFTISGSNAGSIASILTAGFSNIENLTGGSGNDRFASLASGSITGNLNGGSGTNTLDDSGYGSAVTVNLQTTKATGIGGTFAGIQVINGTNTTDTLIGSNSTSTWSLTGANSGTVGSVTFAGFANLTGGTGSDTFKLVPTALVSGSIDGGAGSNTLVGANISNTWDVNGTNAGTLNTTLTFADFQNLTGGTASNTFVILSGGSLAGKVNGTSATGNTLDESLYGSPVTVNLQTKTATALGGTWSNIQAFKGTNTTDTLIGSNSNSTWSLTGTNAGIVSNLTFAGFANLTGGTSGNDTFSFNNGAGVTGVITGGGGTNTLNYSLYTTGVIADLQTLTATGTGGIANIQNITGGKGNDILVGNANANVLSESSSKTGADLIIGGGGADTVTAGGGGDILIDGSTDYDTTVAALNALLQSWEGTGSYATRVQTLQSGVSYIDGHGNTQTALLTTSTINTNPSATKTTLNGGSGADVFFASLGDTINNKTYSAPGNSHTPKTIITI